ncbi:Response regulator receiver domain-containing protein [Marivirga sericea]|uniref:Response regulator receiver domain-containing protein n=1 Tax=Marivirga sericea TaxID=1028 RepID=A0A1X7IG13_9BACT|nr:response regulator [Marivirga sericea]SMG13560.1 Response regulator receiver domain-containing protein [Marivirga sericea]
MTKIKYLIIDDDHVFSLWLKTNLADLFPDFDHISSRVDTLGGLLDIHRNEPDLIFLDQYIDGLSGFDVLDLMKQQPKTIMISSEKVDQSKLAEYPNVIGFIDKPVDLDKLKALLKSHHII